MHRYIYKKKRGCCRGNSSLQKMENILIMVVENYKNKCYAEQGTPIPTSIMVFKKCRQNPENVLFIDSSKYFERGIQNVLRPTDLEKIITTYRERKEVEKYSYLAQLSEIHENEYNLNISGYVNTFKEGEPVDIVTVSKKLKTFETKMSDTDKELIALCKELNIGTPF